MASELVGGEESETYPKLGRFRRRYTLTKGTCGIRASSTLPRLQAGLDSPHFDELRMECPPKSFRKPTGSMHEEAALLKNLWRCPKLKKNSLPLAVSFGEELHIKGSKPIFGPNEGPTTVSGTLKSPSQSDSFMRNFNCCLLWNILWHRSDDEILQTTFSLCSKLSERSESH